VAIVDSGVDNSKLADFGSRLVASVNLSSLSAPGGPADAEGHGTMVAGILAGASPAHPGVAQNAPLVSIRTSDAKGESVTSDVIAAADWILANKGLYNIRVANFSMAGATTTSFRFDPLDKAVESLWFNGVVVVAAAGNHGSSTGGPVGMSYAPGNDPFVITVGATDQMQTADPSDDTVPWWSAYGKTMDGFGKPDLSAPGRFMVAPVPAGSTLPTTVPDRVVAPGYMWMSGTSFSAPIVAGAAAQILARHPDWGPDQVKGAMMLTANYLAGPVLGAAGVGELDAAIAASLDFTPPNPNENLNPFITADPVTGAKAFDQAAWADHVAVTPGWTQASWESASWNSASWDSASWESASWNSASWESNVSSAMANLTTLSESTFAP
jgi:serine protease AprX